MDHKLSVLVQLDLDGRSMCLGITGCLTGTTQRALHPLIHRALTVNPGMDVSVDLSGAEHIEVDGVNRLRSAAGHDGILPEVRPAPVLLPDILPVRCPAVAPLAPAPASRRARTGSTARTAA